MNLLLGVARGWALFVGASGFLFGQLFFGQFSIAATIAGVGGVLAGALGGTRQGRRLTLEWFVFSCCVAGVVGVAFDAYDYYKHLNIPGNYYAWFMIGPFVVSLAVIAAMQLRSRVGTQQADTSSGRLYHGTRADLKPGDLIQPGHASNFTERRSFWVYFSGTLNAATWGAELAQGEGAGRIYEVEPTGSFMDDPNLTNKRFPGNPTKSYRSKEPLRVVREHLDWQGHSPKDIQDMKDGIAGKEPIDD
jgi:rifampin ADP-ribosylating transferase